MVGLRSLRLADNDLRGALPVDFFETNTRLKDLRFYGNKFDEWTASKCGVMRTVSKPKDVDDYTPR